ncbi:uncharacterized protein LOC123504301 [Portunus trituberculatus]|uniref:uncharacterized protein LOC123504301 n=1 Tax=Portunus trituberculatus TaxID=210409 RepID=UPI001E1CE090|nr:uncharacterized protein LOC123504301 [Portunus trituberculatus]
MVDVKAQNLLLGIMMLLVGDIHGTEAYQKNTKRPLRSNKIFKKYDISVNQVQAIDACRIMHGRLALPESKEEDAQIRKIIGNNFYMNPKPYNSAYWLRADDKNYEGYWTDSFTGKPLKYLNFEASQLNSDSEDCLSINSYNSQWNNISCNLFTKGYLCEYTD